MYFSICPLIISSATQITNTTEVRNYGKRRLPALSPVQWAACIPAVPCLNCVFYVRLTLVKISTYRTRVPKPTHKTHNTQHTRVKQNAFCFMQKDTYSSQTCSGGHITPNPTQNGFGWCLFAYGAYKLVPQPSTLKGWPRRTHAHEPGAATATHRLNGAPTVDWVPRNQFRPLDL
jgi:hypothetical protein